MTPAQKQNLAAALRELAERIESHPGHLVGRDIQFEASVSSSPIQTQKISLSLWFIKAAPLARAGALLFNEVTPA